MLFSVLTGIYILHDIIFPAIFKESYYKFLLSFLYDIERDSTGAGIIINSSDEYSYSQSTILTLTHERHILWIITPIIIFTVFTIWTICLWIKKKSH